MTGEAPVEIGAVLEDLATLRAVAGGAEAWEAGVRRACAALTRLLHEGAYPAAWLAAGFPQEPRIPAVDLLHHISAKDRAHVAWAQGAGGRHEGHRVVPLIIHDRPLSAIEIRATYQRSGMEPLIRYLPVGAYLSGVCVVHKAFELDRGE
ncbi:MAG: hypothetical protein ACRDKW_15565, partial [Actinomycetota bacterium]